MRQHCIGENQMLMCASVSVSVSVSEPSYAHAYRSYAHGSICVLVMNVCILIHLPCSCILLICLPCSCISTHLSSWQLLSYKMPFPPIFPVIFAVVERQNALFFLSSRFFCNVAVVERQDALSPFFFCHFL